MTTANPAAELAAMRARGEIDDDEFKLAKMYLAEGLPASTTTPKSGGNLILAFSFYRWTLLFVFVGLMIAQLTVFDLAFYVWGTFVILNVYGLFVLVVGVDGFYRVGACPNCQTQMKVRNEELKSATCPGCKHRIQLRGTELFDIS